LNKLIDILANSFIKLNTILKMTHIASSFRKNTGNINKIGNLFGMKVEFPLLGQKSTERR
jgi:hypothetical protein